MPGEILRCRKTKEPLPLRKITSQPCRDPLKTYIVAQVEVAGVLLQYAQRNSNIVLRQQHSLAARTPVFAKRVEVSLCNLRNINLLHESTLRRLNDGSYKTSKKNARVIRTGIIAARENRAVDLDHRLEKCMRRLYDAEKVCDLPVCKQVFRKKS